jgi:hypothetical protein
MAQCFGKKLGTDTGGITGDKADNRAIDRTDNRG